MPYLLNQLQTVTLNIDPSQEIGSGGMGVVYRIGNVLGSGNLVAKIFKNPADPKNPSKAKLQAMIDRPPEHIYEVINGVGYTQFAWVQHLIFEDDGSLIGYAMPELDFDRSLSLNPFMYPREAERLTDYQNSLNYRVQLGANISALMADLHAHGHAFIDFKEQNLRLLPEPKTGVNDDFKGFIVGFVDCDSFRITGQDGTVYPSPVISPEMTSPEYHEHKDISRLDERHDRFVLAIELFKILNYGIHPFYFIPKSERLKNLSNRNTDQFIKERLYAYGLNAHPEIAPLKNSIHGCWDDITRAMFDDAFLSKNPDDRPTAQQWEDHFRKLINERDFVACQNFPNDISHIHFVGKPCHRCLWQQNQTQPQSTSDSVWRVAASEPPSQNAAVSPWQTINTAEPTLTTPHTTPINSQPTASEQTINHNFEQNLEQNRAWEQSLNQNEPTNAPKIPASQAIPVTPASETAATEAVATAQPVATSEPVSFDNTPAANTPVVNEPINPPSANLPAKKSSKTWLIPLLIGGIGIGGYALTHQKNNQSTTPSSANNTATATADNAQDGESTNKRNNTATAYQTTLDELPAAKATMDKELASQSKGGFFATSSDELYQDSLGFSPEFLSAVHQTAKQGEPDLDKLIAAANSHDIDATMNTALAAFRGADMGYFAKQSGNKALAKQYNETAKKYYWNKKDPKSALYLQAQAVKNSPNQGEYVANLAFYLVKNNFPNAKDFVLYALQTPRDSGKFPNTYMIELASALAVKEKDQNRAVGALLAQYYTADDRAKRCQNMLRYPQTYPELVPIAEKVLIVIDEQNNDGVMPSPNACKPPFNWVK